MKGLNHLFLAGLPTFTCTDTHVVVLFDGKKASISWELWINFMNGCSATKLRRSRTSAGRKPAGSIIMSRSAQIIEERYRARTLCCWTLDKSEARGNTSTFRTDTVIILWDYLQTKINNSRRNKSQKNEESNICCSTVTLNLYSLFSECD